MHKLIAIIYSIAFLIVSNAAPAKNDVKIFDIIEKNFPKTCPVLSENILFKKSNSYLTNCKDVSLMNPPQKIDVTNMNEYFCVGVFASEIQLCKAVKNNPKVAELGLPKDNTELQTIIEQLRKNYTSKTICDEFQTLNLFNDSYSIPTLSKWTSDLNETMKGTKCNKLCSEILSDKVNLLCSMIYYIHYNAKRALLFTNIEENIPPTINPVQSQAENLKSNNEKSNQAINVSQKTNEKIATITKTEPASNPQIVNLTKTNDVTKVGNSEKIETTIQKLPSTINQINNPVQNPELKTIPESILNNNSPVIDETASAPQVSSPINNSGVNKQINPDQEQSKISESNKKNIDSIVSTTTLSSSVSVVRDNPNNVIDNHYVDDDDIDEEDAKLNHDKYSDGITIQKNEESIVDKQTHREVGDQFVDVEDSNFFSYFMFISVLFIAGYVVYHNKQKIMALLVEGRRDRTSRRRPNTSSYRKLNSNLEEAVTSKCSGSASHVIY